MTRNVIFTRAQGWAEVLRDPAPMIDHCVTVLMLALLLCLVGSITFAAAPDVPQHRPTCTPDVFKCCNEPIRDAQCIPVYLPHELREPGPGYRIATTVGRKG